MKVQPPWEQGSRGGGGSLLQAQVPEEHLSQGVPTEQRTGLSCSLLAQVRKPSDVLSSPRGRWAGEKMAREPAATPQEHRKGVPHRPSSHLNALPSTSSSAHSFTEAPRGRACYPRGHFKDED